MPTLMSSIISPCQKMTWDPVTRSSLRTMWFDRATKSTAELTRHRTRRSGALHPHRSWGRPDRRSRTTNPISGPRGSTWASRSASDRPVGPAREACRWLTLYSGDMGGGGKRSSRFRVQAERQLLHGWRLGLFHPRTNESMEFEAPLPADFTRWLHTEPYRMPHSKGVC